MSDLICREDAIDVLAYFDEKDPLGHTPQQIIMALPSVQPDSSEYEELDFVKEHERIPVTLTVQPQKMSDDETCDTCRYRYNDWDEDPCDGCTPANSGYCPDSIELQPPISKREWYQIGYEAGQKSVQPQRMRGRWIGGELGRCSICGHEGNASDIWNGCKGMFCPNCGADNRGTDDVD